MSHKLIQIAQEHPDILERLLTKSTGAIGEILVADALAKIGYKAEPTNNNSEQFDLMVTSPKGKKFGVEVKSDRDRRPTWFVNKCPDPKFSKIWCFVSAPRKPTNLPKLSDVEIYVLTVNEAKKIWKSSEWNNKHPLNGDIRRHQIPNAALNAWDKLPK